MTRLRPQTHRKHEVPSTTNKCSLQDRGRKRVGPKNPPINSPTKRKYTIEFYCAKGIQVDLACSLTPEYYVFCVFPGIFSGVLAVTSLEGKPVNIQGTHQLLSQVTTCLEITILFDFLNQGTFCWSEPSFTFFPNANHEMDQGFLPHLIWGCKHTKRLCFSCQVNKTPISCLVIIGKNLLLRYAYKVYKGFYYVAFLYRWLVTILNQDVSFQLV